MNQKLRTAYFMNKKFIVYPESYAPKFETEHLVVKAEEIILRNKEIKTVIEVGTGTGCISITLKDRQSHIQMIGMEKNPRVYMNFLDNCTNHKVNIVGINTDMYSVTNMMADMVISNPPYIKTSEAEKLAEGSEHIMRNIDGGPDGLNFVRSMLHKFTHSKYILLELGYPESKDIIEKEFREQWEIEEYDKPMNNLEVYFCVLKSTRYWT